MSTNLSPSPKIQEIDSNGVPLTGGLLFTYAAGTTATKLATYTDSSGNTPNTNPIVLDSRGEANIWLPPGTGYKYVLSPIGDTDPPTNPIWTVDNIFSPIPEDFFSGPNGASAIGTTDGLNVQQELNLKASNIVSVAALNAMHTTAVPGGLINLQSYVAGHNDGGGILAKLAAPTTANNVTIFNDADGSSYQRLDRSRITPEMGGCLGLGSPTDDSVAMQRVINYVATTAQMTYPFRASTLYFTSGKDYYCATTPVIQSGVQFSCPGNGIAGGASISCPSSIVLDTPVGGIESCGIDGVNLYGVGNSVNIGFNGRNVTNGTFKNFTTNNTQAQGFLVLAGAGNFYENILCVNALLSRSFSVDVGAFELHDFDPIVKGVYGTGSAAGVTDVSSASLHCTAILAACSEGFFSQCVGQFGDIGIKVATGTGGANKFVNCRADTNFGHGFVNNAGGTQIAVLDILNPAMGTAAATYDGFQNNSINCNATGITVHKSAGVQGRYAVNSEAFSDLTQRSTIGPCVIDAVIPTMFTARYNVDTSADGLPSVELAPSGYATNRSTSTTLDLSVYANQRLIPGSLTNYANVSGAVPGQVYNFVLTNTSVLVNGGGILTKSGQNLTGGAFQAVWPTVSFLAYSPTLIREIGSVDPTGTFTCTAAATTTVNDPNVTSQSVIQLQPTNAAASTFEKTNGRPYISGKSAGSFFSITFVSGTPAGTETYNYVIKG